MTATAIQKTLRGLIAIGALFVLSVLGLGLLIARVDDLDYWTLHTHKVIEELYLSLSALQDVETGERGFVLTNQATYLEPYSWGIDAARKHIAEVKRLTTDNQEQRTDLNKLSELAEAKIVHSTHTIDVAKSGNPDESRTLTVQGKGKQIMDDYRVVVKTIVDTERKLLADRAENLAKFRAATWAAGLFAGVGAMALLIWVFQIVKKAIEAERTRIAELDKEIDQRKRVEKALKDSTVRLSASNTDLQQFAYVASHDLQEPLRAVTGFLTLLTKKSEGKLDEDSMRYIRHAVEGAERMRVLINDLLMYARVDSKGKEFKETNLNNVLQKVRQNIEVLVSETNAQLNYSNLPTIYADEGQLVQLFQNIIANAIKFRGTDDPVITVTAEDKGDLWQISIKDNGRGFDMEHAQRIFVIFQRLQGRDEVAGTGIGLALCKKIVERHRGSIWAESTPGHGANFIFTLGKAEEK